MSTEPSASSVTETAVTEAAPAADTTRQATTPAATTQRVKNPKRVAAGKMVAERTRLAREQQKKAAEAHYAEKQAKAAETEKLEKAEETEKLEKDAEIEKREKKTAEAPKQAASTEGESPKSGGLFGLSANQWIGIGGIGVSLGGLYYNREEILAATNAALDKIRTPKPTPEPAPEPASVETKPARNTRPRGLEKMI